MNSSLWSSISSQIRSISWVLFLVTVNTAFCGGSDVFAAFNVNILLAPSARPHLVEALILDA